MVLGRGTIPVAVLNKRPNLYSYKGIFSLYIYIQGASLRGRLTPPATLAKEGKVHPIFMRSGQRSMVEYYSFLV